jgi:hypothetical protein
VRHHALDICNVTPGPFGTGARTLWSVIKDNIIRDGKKPDQINANLRVGEALYAFADKHQFSGRQREFGALPIGISEKVKYWFDAVISIDGITTVLFMDPRRAEKLWRDHRRFVFSVMRERLNAYPDFTDVRLGIIQFDSPRGSVRQARLYTDEGIDLIGFSQLDAMVQETYRVWADVLAGRRDDLRRRGGGMKGDLL